MEKNRGNQLNILIEYFFKETLLLKKESKILSSIHRRIRFYVVPIKRGVFF